MNKTDEEIQLSIGRIEGIAEALKEGVEKETSKQAGELLSKEISKLLVLLKEENKRGNMLRIEIEKLEAEYGVIGKEGFKDAILALFTEKCLEVINPYEYCGNCMLVKEQRSRLKKMIGEK